MRRDGLPQTNRARALGQDEELDLAYAQMARDEQRESEALELSEATVGDMSDGPR